MKTKENKMQIAKMMSSPLARAVRAVIGLVLLYAGYKNGGGLGIVLIVLGVVFLLSGLLNFCGLAKILGGPFWAKTLNS